MIFKVARCRFPFFTAEQKIFSYEDLIISALNVESLTLYCIFSEKLTDFLGYTDTFTHVCYFFCCSVKKQS